MKCYSEDNGETTRARLSALAERVRANIAAFRRSKCLRQEDFAAVCGWGRHVIARLEAGECSWSLAKIQHVAEVFNLPAVYFLLVRTDSQEDTSLVRVLRALEAIEEP